jgi:colanic acid/amylovoran biosynthesis glycosyltransferase
MTGNEGHAGPLKIAYLLHRFPYRTETFIVREMHGVVEAGAEVSIFSMMAPGSDSASDQGERLMAVANYSAAVSGPVVAANLRMMARRPLRYVRSLLRLIGRTWREPAVMALTVGLFPKAVLYAQQIERRGIQHMHAHFVWIEGLAAGVVRDLTGIPFTIQPHAFGLFGRNQTNVRLELSDATGIVTISEYNRRHITDLDPSLAPRIDVVHCGVDIERFPPKPHTDDDDGPVRILSVGRAIEKKGHEYLIDACALLRDRGFEFECDLVVGFDEGSAQLQRRIDGHAVGDRVRLRDMVDERGVIRYLHGADIFALACVVSASGDRDGIPVALMEAMACELPVVSTTVSGVPELVKDGAGLLAPPNDASALADALERLIGSRQLRMEMGRRGRAIVAEEFSASAGAARMYQIFQRHAVAHRPAGSVVGK